LGLELAAAWVRALPLSEIAEEIGHDLDFLTTSVRDIPERHRSLRVVFDHSWSLLLPAEQRALRQLSVFRGGFTREAAQAVAGTDLPILNSLIDKSLLRRSELGRFDLHELVRVYAAARLAEGPIEEASTQEQHSKFFLSFLGDVGLDLHNSHQKEALARLSTELANIRLAWIWALAHDQIELLGEAAQSQWYFFELLNYYREAEAVFARTADAVRRNLQEQKTDLAQDREKYVGALGQFLMHQAYFTMRLGRVDEAEALCLDSISTLRSVDDPEALARALSYYAFLNWSTGRLDQARDLLQECLPLSRDHGSPWQIALFTGFLGNVAHERGEYELSYRLLNEALERSQVIGDPRLIGYMSAYLSRAALKLKRTGEIEGILRESAHLTQESGDRFGYGLILEQLALTANARGDFSSAEKLFEASADLFGEMEDVWNLPRVLTTWGDHKLSLGELPSAAERFRQAIRISLEAQTLPVALNALLGLAKVYAQEHKTEAALEIALYVKDHPTSTQDARDRAHQIQRDLVARLTPSEAEAAYQRARAYTFEEITSNYL
jgi:predicted ATPase